MKLSKSICAAKRSVRPRFLYRFPMSCICDFVQSPICFRTNILQMRTFGPHPVSIIKWKAAFELSLLLGGIFSRYEKSIYSY
jgi:hypothetical protein